MEETGQPSLDWKSHYGHLFEEGEDGLPKPGHVVKYFREVRQMDTKALAKVLGVTKRTVERMENEHLFLDSISRRRALAAALRIPPVLLGVTTFSGMQTLQYSQVAAVQTTTKTLLAVVKSVEELKQALTAYRGGHETNTRKDTVQDRLEQIEQDISNQRQVLSLFGGPERLERQYVLFGYYLLAIDVARDGPKYQAVFRHAESAMELALSLNVPEVKHPELVTAA
jgi:transcriptional regulator with XRE-family HTH domain